MSTQPTSTEVRVAALLMAVASGFGVLVLLLGVKLLTVDDSFLFVVLPVVATFLMVVGLFVAVGALGLTLRLARRRPGSRLQTAAVGGCLLFTSVFVLAASVPAGLLLALYGGALLWLMTTPAAARDLGPWLDHLRQPAPWGSRPGTRLWSAEPAQQGPWAPDPRTIPWTSWKGHSGPRPPWWETWRTGLAQGIPLWELLLLVGALLAFAVGLVAVPLHLTGSHLLHNLGWEGSPLWLLPVPASIGVVAWLEKRMRHRLATRG